MKDCPKGQLASPRSGKGGKTGENSGPGSGNSFGPGSGKGRAESCAAFKASAPEATAPEDKPRHPKHGTQKKPRKAEKPEKPLPVTNPETAKDAEATNRAIQYAIREAVEAGMDRKVAADTAESLRDHCTKAICFRLLVKIWTRAFPDFVITDGMFNLLMEKIECKLPIIDLSTLTIQYRLSTRNEKVYSDNRKIDDQTQMSIGELFRMLLPRTAIVVYCPSTGETYSACALPKAMPIDRETVDLAASASNKLFVTLKVNGKPGSIQRMFINERWYLFVIQKTRGVLVPISELEDLSMVMGYLPTLQLKEFFRAIHSSLPKYMDLLVFLGEGGVLTFEVADGRHITKPEKDGIKAFLIAAMVNMRSVDPMELLRLCEQFAITSMESMMEIQLIPRPNEALKNTILRHINEYLMANLNANIEGAIFYFMHGQELVVPVKVKCLQYRRERAVREQIKKAKNHLPRHLRNVALTEDDAIIIINHFEMIFAKVRVNNSDKPTQADYFALSDAGKAKFMAWLREFFDVAVREGATPNCFDITPSEGEMRGWGWQLEAWVNAGKLKHLVLSSEDVRMTPNVIFMELDDDDDEKTHHDDDEKPDRVTTSLLADSRDVNDEKIVKSHRALPPPLADSDRGPIAVPDSTSPQQHPPDEMTLEEACRIFVSKIKNRSLVPKDKVPEVLMIFMKGLQGSGKTQLGKTMAEELNRKCGGKLFIYIDQDENGGSGGFMQAVLKAARENLIVINGRVNIGGEHLQVYDKFTDLVIVVLGIINLAGGSSQKILAQGLMGVSHRKALHTDPNATVSTDPKVKGFGIDESPNKIQNVLLKTWQQHEPELDPKKYGLSVEVNLIDWKGCEPPFDFRKTGEENLQSLKDQGFLMSDGKMADWVLALYLPPDQVIKKILLGLIQNNSSGRIEAQAKESKQTKQTKQTKPSKPSKESIQVRQIKKSEQVKQSEEVEEPECSQLNWD